MNNFIEKLKSRSPLIHNITNMVTINDVANIELACGARPIMAMAPQEMDEVTVSAMAESEYRHSL